MTIVIKGKIEKGSIRVPKKTGLPDGTPVIVTIEPLAKVKEKLEIISELCGAWSDDPTITSAFEAIEQERHCYFGRKVGFE